MNISLQSNIYTTGFSLISSFNLKPIIKCPNISCRYYNNNANITREKPVINHNYYDLLSLGSRDVGLQEIKKAYRGMALRYHPDVACHKSDDPYAKTESTRRFLELRKAYETLSDPASRELYDCELTLIDDQSQSDFGFERRSSLFSNEVWENQLRGLRRRSELVRMKRRK